MADVFVSYSRSDKARVAPLVAAIEAQGWTVWWDPSIAPGQEFDREIEAELKGAAAVLVVWTPRSVESRWVRGEAREALARGILVPVRFDGASLPIDVRALHTVDLDDWEEDAESPPAHELLRALGATIARQSGSQSWAASGRATPPASAVPKAQPQAKNPVAEMTSAPDGEARVRRSVAVLPFANLTGDPAKDYLGDGLAEELIHTLARVSGLRVPARTSSFAYKGRNFDLRRIAAELDVDAVLEGSVRAAGERIRITAQLIDGDSGFHLWSEHYDRRFENLFEVQDELANAIIVQTLNATTQASGPQTPLRAPPTQSFEAYRLFLEALADQARLGPGNRRAFEKLQQALRLDPGFARARAVVAQLRSFSLVFGVPLPGTLADAEHEALQALELNPESAATHAALGTIRAAQARWLEAEESFAQAFALDDADPSIWSGHGLSVSATVGHLGAYLSSSCEAHRLAPASAGIHTNLVVAYAFPGNEGELRKHAQLAFDLGVPRTYAPVADILSYVNLDAGRYDAARALMQEAVRATLKAPRAVEAVGRVFDALAGASSRSGAVAALDGLRADVSDAGLNHMMRMRLIMWYSRLEAYDQAYEMVNRSLDDFAAVASIGTAWGFLWTRELAGFRDDGRFTALVARLRLPDYWQRYGPPDGYDWRDGRLVAR
jgi:adenylate cyclase